MMKPEKPQNLNAANTPTRWRAGAVAASPSGGLTVTNPANGATVFYATPQGNLYVGSDVNEADGVSIMVFSAKTTWNTEVMDPGDMLLGDNSTGAANIKWDASVGRFELRSGQTTTLYLATDGSLEAGAGAVKLNALGVSMDATAVGSTNPEKMIKFLNTADETIATIGGYEGGMGVNNQINIVGETVSGKDCTVYINGKNVQVSSNSGGVLTLSTQALVVDTSVVPGSASDTGIAGQVAWDTGYFYVCVDTDTWKRTPLSTW